MKTRLITISRNTDQIYYIGIGIGFEYDKYGYFVGVIAAFLCWTIRVGFDRGSR